MKNMYQRMSKIEKKDILNKYKKTPKGKYIIGKLRNLLIIGIISYIYAVYLFISSKNVWDYISAGTLFIGGCIFIISSIKLKIRNLNNYIINKK